MINNKTIKVKSIAKEEIIMKITATKCDFFVLLGVNEISLTVNKFH